MKTNTIATLATLVALFLGNITSAFGHEEVVPEVSVQMVPMITVSGEPGIYQVEYSTDLSAGSWVYLDSVTITNTNQPIAICDSTAIGQPQRFYRASIADATFKAVDISAVASTDGESGRFRFEFSITAGDHDIYIPVSLATIQYKILNDSNQVIKLIETLTFESYGLAGLSSHYRVQANTTAKFIFTVYGANNSFSDQKVKVMLTTLAYREGSTTAPIKELTLPSSAVTNLLTLTGNN